LLDGECVAENGFADSRIAHSDELLVDMGASAVIGNIIQIKEAKLEKL
jgi:hypothetical protein